MTAYYNILFDTIIHYTMSMRQLQQQSTLREQLADQDIFHVVKFSIMNNDQ